MNVKVSISPFRSTIMASVKQDLVTKSVMIIPTDVDGIFNITD